MGTSLVECASQRGAAGIPQPPARRPRQFFVCRFGPVPTRKVAGVSVVALRPIDDTDLDAIFEQMLDPASVRMAAFTAEDPNDRAAFDAHMAQIVASPEATMLAVTCDDELVGTIGSFVFGAATEVTYWIHRSWWGRGIATRALALLLDVVTVRPLEARAASDNAGSLRVLRKNDFRVVATEMSYAQGRGVAIEETILRLD
jgi:RimJ/RimL family protein N-acetyltransferase